ncbi:late competence protein ComER [Brevibacillus centrosporus]|uniref:late competence protein ComER n=1 Tax=Brevibacillus centrosporus TaxID=54910 RepID=UPI002E1BE6EB|nr:late competence protein ComER [Brevibacillus centrosporus]MED1952429.1 late competence protein ComER [Brevibacillus centrosporus]
MDRIGFIGTGSMGTILIEALLSSKALSPGQIMIGNRTPAKAERLAELYPGLVVAPSNAELAEAAKVLLLCVKPLEYKVLLEQITPVLTPEHLLITITSPIKLSLLEERVPCAVARVVPSITNAARSGISLCEFGSRIDEAQKQYILKLFSSISHPTMVSEAFLRVTSDITSCGPAFLSYILQQMIQEAVNETGISEDAATYLTTQMFIGMADLLKEDIFTLPSLQQRVCVPGGITGEGLIPLKEGIPGLFTEVYRRTHAKFAEDQEQVEQRLTNHQR